MTTQEVSRVTVVLQPSLEPLSLQQVRKHLEIADSDTVHDVQLYDLIRAARAQWEDDTDSAVLTQTLSVSLEGFWGDRIILPRRPIQSIVSVVYRDTIDAEQTFSADDYSLNPAACELRLGYNASWPSVYSRWDAVTITYVAGEVSPKHVHPVAKQAMLLLVGYYFENRDMLSNETIYNRSAYEALARRYMRSTYP